MDAKEKAIKHLIDNNIYSCGYYDGDPEDIINQALDIAIKEAKKEAFDVVLDR